MQENKRILVTGATGFIGTAVFKRLLSEGYAVDGISLHGGKVGDKTIHAVDLTSAHETNDYFKQKEYDAVVHLAACIPAGHPDEHPEECFFTNIGSTEAILRYLSRQKNRCHIIYASSVAVYGRNISSTVYENTPPSPDSYYASSKYAGEILCHQFGITHGMKSTIFRISSPFGAGMSLNSVVGIFSRNVLAGESIRIFGSGQRTQDFIHVHDIAQAVVTALQTGVSDTFNIASGCPVSMLALAHEIIESFPGSSSRIIMSGIEDPQEHYRGSFSIEKARTGLDFTPRTQLREGLRELLDHMVRK